MTGATLEEGLRLLAHHDLAGWPNGGEGMAIQLLPDGRRYLYVAHHSAPGGVSILDVGDPRDPRLVHRWPTLPGQGRTNSLSLHGDTLLVACEAKQVGGNPAGLHIYDVADPSRPHLLGFHDTSGPFSPGTHFVNTPDGEFAYLSTGAADFEPATAPAPKDDQFLLIVDIRDRSRPREVARWWLPGQRKGEDVELERHRAPSIDQGFRLHHVLVYPQRTDRAYLGYVDAGVVILDIADRSRPRAVGRLDYHPPAKGYTHTVVPIFDRDLLVVSDEASGRDGDDGYDWPKRVWLVDARDEAAMRVLSHMPDPENVDQIRARGGRTGSHNIHENEPAPGSAHLRNTVVAALFSAGLRIYDTSDPTAPKEIAAFVPPTPDGQRGSRITDVFVDDRGILYVLDRVRGGLYLLEYTGDHPLS